MRRQPTNVFLVRRLLILVQHATQVVVITTICDTTQRRLTNAGPTMHSCDMAPLR